MDPRTIERIWFGADALARSSRVVLAPLGWLYAATGGARNALYDHGVLAAAPTALPTVSIGNLTVGGTGKTPIAAEVARRLAAGGASPAIVLRGYGADEPLVHGMLNPAVPVVVAADRVRGVAEAQRRGADVAVLDDAFQHRRVSRVGDIVLVSADRWSGARRRPLPAGPWREPLTAIRRATLAIVTRKAAPDGVVAAALAAVAAAAPDCPIAVARLTLAELRAAEGDARRPLDALRGRSVAAIAAVGDPGAFVRQLEAAGARVAPHLFADHHAFSAADVVQLAAAASAYDIVVCTLKDAVKLAPVWPRAAIPLWYVSQSVHFERGEAGLDRMLQHLLAHRSTHT